MSRSPEAAGSGHPAFGRGSRRHARACLAGLALLVSIPGASLPGAAEDATVLAIQEMLAAMGYDPGPVDGIPGGNTVRAIKAFQREFGLAVTGEADVALLDRISARAAGGAVSPEQLLAREGLLRSYTRAVQEALADLGYDPGPVDGAAGPQTRAAIRRWQEDRGLTVTGEISKLLLSGLNDAFGS